MAYEESYILYMRKVIIYIFAIWLAVTAASSDILLPGKYSWLYSKKFINQQERSLVAQDVCKDVKTHSNQEDGVETQFTLELDSDLVQDVDVDELKNTLKLAIHRAFSVKEDYDDVDQMARIYVNEIDGQNICIANLKCWPFGTKSFCFKQKNMRKCLKSDDKTVEIYASEDNENKIALKIDFRTPQPVSDSASSLPNRCILEIAFSFAADSVKVRLKACNVGTIARKDLKRILLALAGLLHRRLQDETSLALGRRRQKILNAQQAVEAKQALQRKKIDKIKNPEKYKSLSPTVRRPGGAGRFIPAGRSSRVEVRRRRG